MSEPTKVYCSNCEFFIFRNYDGIEACDSPSNLKDSYYAKNVRRIGTPSSLNNDNYCLEFSNANERKYNLVH